MNTINEFSEYGKSLQAPYRIDTNRKPLNPSIIIESLLNLAFLSLSENQAALAKAHYLNALEVARHAGTPSLEVKPLLGLSSLALNCNKDGQAREYRIPL